MKKYLIAAALLAATSAHAHISLEQRAFAAGSYQFGTADRDVVRETR
jgi:periplasmic copper chaperone A